MIDMHPEIRPATRDDAAAIARLKQQVWSDEKRCTEQVAFALDQNDQVTFVAVASGTIAGFVAAFPTLSREGTRRWEIDLLAVDPAYRRRGIASRLVRASTGAGRERGAAFARTLIRVDNRLSGQTFQRCGYGREPAPCYLYVSRRQVLACDALPREMHLVAVRTLSYCGYWVEGAILPEGLLAAQGLRTSEGTDLVGLVIPAADAEGNAAALATGFSRVGCYHWWRLDLNGNRSRRDE